MHLLLITPLYPPAVGGAATYFADIVPCLEDYDQIKKIFVLTEKMSGQPGEATHGKVSILRLLPTRISQQRPYLFHALSYLQTQIWFTTKLSKIIQANDINIVHFHTRYRGRLFYRAMRKQIEPVIADLRDKMSDPQVLASASKQLLCCSYGIFEFAKAGGYPPNNIKYIPATFKQLAQPSSNSLTNTLQRYNLTNRRYILYVGDMNYNKGVYDLIEAFNTWQKQYPEVKLVLVGANRDGNRFLSVTKNFSNIYYIGHVDRHEVVSLMAKSDIVILPSRSEGLPSVILEALALGRKVICPPNIVEFSQYLPDYVLAEVNVQQIIDKLDFVWNDETLPTYPLENHDPKMVVAQLVDMYSNL